MKGYPYRFEEEVGESERVDHQRAAESQYLIQRLRLQAAVGFGGFAHEESILPSLAASFLHQVGMTLELLKAVPVLIGNKSRFTLFQQTYHCPYHCW